MFDFLLERKIKSKLKNLNNKPRGFLNFSAIKRVLILFDINDWNEVQPIVADLERNKKFVSLVTLDKNPTFDLPVKVWIISTAKDLNRLKMFKSEVINRYQNLEYDTFIDLDFSDNKLMFYLKAANTSYFSIGFQESDYKLYDFALLKEEHKTFYETYQDAKKYITNNTQD